VCVCVCVQGRREADERNRFTLPPHLQLKNLELLGNKSRATQARASQAGSGLTQLFAKVRCVTAHDKGVQGLVPNTSKREVDSPSCLPGCGMGCVTKQARLLTSSSGLLGTFEGAGGSWGLAK